MPPASAVVRSARACIARRYCEVGVNFLFGIAVRDQSPVDLLKQIFPAAKIFVIRGHKFREKLLNLLMVLLQYVNCIHFASPYPIPTYECASAVPGAHVRKSASFPAESDGTNPNRREHCVWR